MCKIFFTLIILLFTFSSHGQVSGRILNQSEMPIPFANTMLFASNSNTLYKGTITNDDGKFKIDDIKPGTYVLQVSLLSYQTWVSKPFTVSDIESIKQFPTITLLEEATSLSEVSIVAKKKLIEQTKEGNIINVQQSVLTKGSNALQVLERSPGVILDQRNNNFSLNGKSGTTIMINGKPMRMPTADLITMLSGMNADNIKSIELLTNPSARYDVDGTAGIINIVLIKNETLGTRGTFNTTSGYGIGPKQTTSFSLHHGHKKFNTYATYSFSYDDTFSQWSGIGSTENPTFGGTTFISFSSKTEQLNRSHNATAGIEYIVNENTYFGANILVNHANPTIITNNQGFYDFETDPYLEAQILLRGQGKWNNFTNSVFFETKKKTSTIGLSADYISYNNKTPNLVKSTYLDENGEEFIPDNDIYNTENRGINETDIKIGVLKADFKKTINNNFDLEMGIKGSLSKTKNQARIEILENNEFIIDDRFISNRQIDETIAATYGILNHKINTTITAQFGMRYEYWKRSFDDTSLDRNFGKLFPSVFLTKTISDTQNINLVYTKRITRPNYSDLASYLSYNSPTSVFSGNPQLLPAISNTVSLSYTYKSTNYSIAFTNEDNPIARFQVEEDPISDLAVIAPQNLQYQNSLDFQINKPFKFNNWFNLNLNGTIGLREFKILHTPQPFTHDYIHFNLNGNQTINFPKQLSFELSGWYTSNHFNGSSKVFGFGSLNMGVKKEFKNGSTLQFSITDVLESITIKSKIGTLTTEAYNNIFDVEYSPESTNSRIFRLSYSYTFGNKKVRSTKQNTNANEEKSRIQE
ncbi:hypothetical protein AWE51_02645 [Aquimarina aggregata]|uniref:Outer membrane protein beta-barrel domain-containing protein n=1 Tax=Aquimarina aggregata TaxID=1642818 RepID=A0A162DLV9_9FLAO|nr:outer membrane beta-barrel family protein [Aquimarina aggregata]KZS42358.1 hypothetical protein AWE51_02645 [Aquimarina aggregata]